MNYLDFEGRGSRSRSERGQLFEWVIAAGAGIHIDGGASKYHRVSCNLWLILQPECVHILQNKTNFKQKTLLRHCLQN